MQHPTNPRKTIDTGPQADTTNRHHLRVGEATVVTHLGMNTGLLRTTDLREITVLVGSMGPMAGISPEAMANVVVGVAEGTGEISIVDAEGTAREEAADMVDTSSDRASLFVWISCMYY